MPIRSSEAKWNGTLKEGGGTVKLGSGAFEGPYSFPSRFESGQGTNPEELIGAAHASCYSMALAAALSKDGFSPKRIHTVASVSLDKVGDGFEITSITLKTEGDVPGIEQGKFLEYAENAKKGCPVSKALAGMEIKLEAKLLAAV